MNDTSRVVYYNGLLCGIAAFTATQLPPPGSSANTSSSSQLPAVNPHQFSHVNEAKLSVASGGGGGVLDGSGGNPQAAVKQVIPKNLSVHSKTSTHHHKLSVSTRGGSTSTRSAHYQLNFDGFL